MHRGCIIALLIARPSRLMSVPFVVGNGPVIKSEPRCIVSLPLFRFALLLARLWRPGRRGRLCRRGGSGDADSLVLFRCGKGPWGAGGEDRKRMGGEKEDGRILSGG